MLCACSAISPDLAIYSCISNSNCFSWVNLCLAMVALPHSENLSWSCAFMGTQLMPLDLDTSLFIYLCNVPLEIARATSIGFLSQIVANLEMSLSHIPNSLGILAIAQLSITKVMLFGGRLWLPAISPVGQYTGWSWTYSEHPWLQPSYYLLLKHFDWNDVGVVGKAELDPEMEGLVVTPSMCVGLLLAVVTTVHPTASICCLSVLIVSVCLKVWCLSLWSNSDFQNLLCTLYPNPTLCL